MYLIKNEREQPYKRVDAKYRKLFNESFKEYTRFKATQLKNFQKTTKMIVQVLEDFAVTKKVIMNLQNEFDKKHEMDKTMMFELHEDLEKDKQKFNRQLKQLETDAIANEQSIIKCQKMVYDNQIQAEKNFNDVHFRVKGGLSELKEHTQEQEARLMQLIRQHGAVLPSQQTPLQHADRPPSTNGSVHQPQIQLDELNE